MVNVNIVCCLDGLKGEKHNRNCGHSAEGGQEARACGSRVVAKVVPESVSLTNGRITGGE